jgi:hypothetical protein
MIINNIINIHAQNTAIGLCTELMVKRHAKTLEQLADNIYVRVAGAQSDPDPDT